MPYPNRSSCRRARPPTATTCDHRARRTTSCRITTRITNVRVRSNRQNAKIARNDKEYLRNRGRMAHLELNNLTKRFGPVTAVNGMSLEVADREFLVLLGPSGAGKTTTLRCVAGLE